MKIYITFITAAIILLFHSQLAYPFPKTDADFALLPPYCHARLRGTPSQKKIWQRRFGHKSFTHLHHYCSALDWRNKANISLTKKDREYFLNRAIKQFDYIINAAPSSFKLMPENYYGKGKAYQELGKTGPALEAYNTSIKINKKYAKGYAAISDLYIDTGNRAEAIEILKKGLKYVPKSKGLKRRFKKITGKSTISNQKDP